MSLNRLGVDATVTDLDGGNTGNANFSGSDMCDFQRKKSIVEVVPLLTT
jgi:hypothetical protein